jgi:ribonucleoside-diphosphate reductase alpha chain
MQGPLTRLAQEVQADKHRMPGETFEEATERQAEAMADGPEHKALLKALIGNQAFLPAGRVQKAVGSSFSITAFNCFVAATIKDSMAGIMDNVKEAALTLQQGGGDGFDFSTIRPRGAVIKGVGAPASGPVSFMHIWNAMCGTIMSAGARRGAMMGMLRVDHPDILEFIQAKTVKGALTNFNVSVAVTDQFMKMVDLDGTFDLVFDGDVYETIWARDLWDALMANTWEHAEPGIIFIDVINRMNNLWYCEEIAATNPCGEQPLPPHGACLLGSLNLVKFLVWVDGLGYVLDVVAMNDAIPVIVRALDNVVDRTNYPLPEQKAEAKAKRRMGIGVTGAANAIEALGMRYGSDEAQDWIGRVMRNITINAYDASCTLAEEKGAFPLFDMELYSKGNFFAKLPSWLQVRIRKHGLRNSHLISIAPTGSISIAADNVSGGIEPVFATSYDRKVLQPDGSTITEKVEDYGSLFLGNTPTPASEVTIDEHLGMQASAQKWVDSAISKTINLSGDESQEEFRDVYMKAWKLGLKGCTTFNPKGSRMGILIADVPKDDPPEGAACFIDPQTGQKECS